MAALQQRLRADARKIFEAGLEAADPERALRRFVHFRSGKLSVAGRSYPIASPGRIYVIGAGKAAFRMAAPLEELLGDRIAGGLLAVPRGTRGRRSPLQRIETVEAGHPVPDSGSEEAASQMLKLLGRTAEGDVVLAVISGGASALLCAPAEGLELEDKRETTRVLLECGAGIGEINTLRKHLSRIKGGLLAAAASPSRLAALILSDVAGDRLETIASGPTAGDPTTFVDCVAIARRYGILDRLPERVARFLCEGEAGRRSETPKPGDPLLESVHNVIIAGNRDALEGAAAEAAALGYKALVLSSSIEGEARHVGSVNAAIARESALNSRPAAPPACIISGGETTVTVRGRGLGGRNQELVLAGAIGIDGLPGVVLLSAGTDGIDGETDAAGAVADGATVARALEKGLRANEFLDRNDAYSFFRALDDLVVTGPTGTNVMDLMLVLVGESSGMHSNGGSSGKN